MNLELGRISDIEISRVREDSRAWENSDRDLERGNMVELGMDSNNK